MKIFVKVKANASREEIKQSDKDRFEVWTKEQPVEGKANRAVIKLLAGHFKIPPSRMRISSGLKSREKVILIDEN